TTDAGVMEVGPPRRLAGRVVFADGKRDIPKGTTLTVSRENGWDSRRVDVGPDGRFEGKGLPPEMVSVRLSFPKSRRFTPDGYRFSRQNKCLDPANPWRLMGRLNRDVDDLVILLEPGEEHPYSLDPGLMADFKEAKEGLIAGAK